MTEQSCFLPFFFGKIVFWGNSVRFRCFDSFFHSGYLRRVQRKNFHQIFFDFPAGHPARVAINGIDRLFHFIRVIAFLNDVQLFFTLFTAMHVRVLFIGMKKNWRIGIFDFPMADSAEFFVHMSPAIRTYRRLIVYFLMTPGTFCHCHFFFPHIPVFWFIFQTSEISSSVNTAFL